MSVARRFAAALAVFGAGVLAYAVPASATEDTGAGAENCITNPTAADLVANLYPRQGLARVRAADGKNVCADVLLSIYRVPDSWDGKGFNDSAVPQTVITTVKGRIEGTAKTELSVPVPDCGSLQVDLYFPPEITTVNRAGHGSQLIQGYIWKWFEGGQPKLCKPETTPTPTPTETSPVPTPTETTPVPTPSETSPVPTPSETSPVPTPSETTPVPTPTQGLGEPIPVPTPTAPAAPPVLAETGSDSTVPLVGLGMLLLAAGLGLSLMGRRRTA